jgi:hypothetical protein
MKMTTNCVKAFNALESVMLVEIVTLAAIFAASIAFGFALILLAAGLYLATWEIIIPGNLEAFTTILPVLMIFLISFNYILPQCLSVMDDAISGVYALTKTDRNERWFREKWEHFLCE